MAAYVRDRRRAIRRAKFECVCCEMVDFRVCGVRQNKYVFSLYRNPDLDDWIFDCLLTSLAAALLMAIIISGWVLQPRIGMVLQYETLQQCLVVISVLPTTQFAYRNGLGTCDASLRVSHTLQSAL